MQFPGLEGILPGFGRFSPNDWGLGLELRDRKQPHWTGARNSPTTFGHFGRSGGFLWVDPEAGLALACLSDLDFGAWAKEAWPRLADAVSPTRPSRRRYPRWACAGARAAFRGGSCGPAGPPGRPRTTPSELGPAAQELSRAARLAPSGRRALLFAVAEAEHPLDVALRQRAERLGLRLAVFEQDHQGDRLHAVAVRQLPLVVNVDLDDLQPVLVRDPIEDGGDAVARGAPLGPESRRSPCPRIRAPPSSKVVSVASTAAI